MNKKTFKILGSLLFSIGLASCVSSDQHMVKQILETQEANSRFTPPSAQGFTVDSLDEAYKIQAIYNSEKSKSFGPISGYKIAYASLQSQKANGINEPVYGALFEKQRVPNGGIIKVADFSGFHIESEIAVIIDKDIPAGLKNPSSLKPYIRSVHVGYDIPDNIFDVSQGKPVPNDIVIFGAGAHTYSIGPAHELKDISFSGNKLDVFFESKKVYEGNENNTMGSPLNSLFWLYEKLQSQGKTLRTHEVVLCGAVGGAFKASGDNAKGTYTANHPLLGKVSIEVK